LRFDAVRLKGTGPDGAVHQRTLEPVTSAVRSYRAREVLCNQYWTDEQLESVPLKSINCGNCAKRELEITEARRSQAPGGPDRPFSKASIGELEKIFETHKSDNPVLGRLREELTYRKTERAKQLRREVEGVIEGLVPVEKRTRAARPEDQLRLLDKGS
jgi:hypothetical protein